MNTVMKPDLEKNLKRLTPLILPQALRIGNSGRIGYLVAWLLGVPASVLFVIFLIRGH